MINHFEESEIPYGTLERFGLTQDMVEDLPVDVLQNIHNGRRSPGVTYCYYYRGW
jgi:hypothetical protein